MCLTHESAIRVAVVGVGSFGRNHARVYHELSQHGAELVAVVDSNLSTAEAVASRFSCKAFGTVEELFGRVDAVSVAVPTVHHLQTAAALMAAGIDVLIEKPVASSLEEADELAALAKAHNRIVQVGIRPSAPPFRC
jgi:predicted dehydrogenase